MGYRVLLLVGLTLFQFQCNEQESDCSTPATVRDLTGTDGCGWVFELEDGTRLEPYWQWGWCGTPPLPEEMTDDPLYNFQYVEGKRVLIRYAPTEGLTSVCMAGPIVKITCISEAVIIAEE